MMVWSSARMVIEPSAPNGESIFMPRSASAMRLPSALFALRIAATRNCMPVAASHDQLVGYSL